MVEDSFKSGKGYLKLVAIVYYCENTDLGRKKINLALSIS